MHFFCLEQVQENSSVPFSSVVSLTLLFFILSSLLTQNLNIIIIISISDFSSFVSLEPEHHSDAAIFKGNFLCLSLSLVIIEHFLAEIVMYCKFLCLQIIDYFLSSFGSSDFFQTFICISFTPTSSSIFFSLSFFLSYLLSLLSHISFSHFSTNFVPFTTFYPSYNPLELLFILCFSSFLSLFQFHPLFFSSFFSFFHPSSPLIILIITFSSWF